MQYVLIGVGGTGARILEAFTYLSAAGVFGREIPRVHMRMIEMDVENGNLLRLIKVLKKYSECRSSVFSHVNEWEAREIIFDNTAPFVWQVGVDGDTDTLSQKFNKGTENMNLLNGFYSSDDLTLSLEKGCKGRPRIGALEYTKRFQDDCGLGAESFWNNFFSGELATMESDSLRVMLVGSIFGGSGASGVPNLAKLIKDTFCTGDGNTLGLTLMSPFYNFSDNLVKEDKGAESRKFMINSKTALLYYAQSDVMDSVHSMYVVGGKVRPMYKEDGRRANDSTGNKKQCNPAMPELLVSALCAFDFFHTAGNYNSGQAVYVDTGYTGEDNWSAYPYSEKLKSGLTRLQRLTMLWRTFRNKINDDKDWKSLYKTYGKKAFNQTINFLENTAAIQEFFLGETSREPSNEPWNIGAEGFLQELQRNGMKGIVDVSGDKERVDKMRFDDANDVLQLVSGIPFRDLHNSFKAYKNINVGNLRGEEKELAKFIAGATAACFVP